MKRSGFSLIEILVAMAVIAVMALLVVPVFRRPQDSVTAFFQQLQSLVQYGIYQATLERTEHRLFFTFPSSPAASSGFVANTIELQRATTDRDSKGNVKFEPLTVYEHVHSRIDMPRDFQIRQFYINGTDVIPGGKTKDAWVDISSQGFIQPVIINGVLTNASPSDAFDQVRSCVINPITGQLTVYHEAQQP